MGKIESGRCVVLTFILGVPPDVDNVQAQQVLPAGVTLAMPLSMQLAFPMRGSFIEMKNEPAEQVATRYNKRMMQQADADMGRPGPKLEQ